MSQVSDTASAPSFTVAFKGQTIPVDLDLASTTVLQLKEFLEPFVQLPPTSQKLLFKRQLADADLLSDYGLQPHSRVMLVGTAQTQIEQTQAMAKKAAFREAQQQKALLNQRIRPLVSDRLTQQDLQQRQYTFHAIETLPHYRDAHVARSLLERLKNDRGIQTIMKAHKWSVGLLKELDPAVATILGFNRNAGMEIALRLRTDDREGFRHYDSIRKVLLHELAHMVHGDHDEHFHALNRQLNKECDAVHREAHLLDGSRLPSSVSAQQAAAADSQDELSVPYFSGGAFVLGGSIPGGNPGSDGETSAAAETSQQRRELLLRAVMNRLSAEEQEIMESCSSTESKPSA